MSALRFALPRKAVIVRGYRRHECTVKHCGGWAAYACDHPGCKGKLCERHAYIQAGKVGPGGRGRCHYCPEHDQAVREMEMKR